MTWSNKLLERVAIYKFYSTGVDVTLQPTHFLEILSQLQRLLARMLIFLLVINIEGQA